MTVLEIAALLASGAAAGAINAVAGGGTLVTFPTLLFFNTAPVVANATSTFALVVGTGGSIFGFRRHLRAVAPWLWRFTPVSILGGLLGSELLTRTNERLFSKLVPFLILFATVLFLLNGLFRFGSKAGEGGRNRIWVAVVFQFFVSVYGGYFGAGIGILMLATLGFLGMKDIHEMNTVKTTIGSLINVVAAISFVAHGLVNWPKAGVMMVGAVAGYYFGSHFSQRISPRRVRLLIVLIGLGISVITFYEQFLKSK